LRDGDPGAFLAAMLEGVKTQIGELGGLRVSAYGKDPTMVVELVIGKGTAPEERKPRVQSLLRCSAA
jgi:hypothetical protein